MDKNSKTLITNIQNRIEEEARPPLFSVFDADGTLWKEDANNIFLNYEEKYKLRKVAYLMDKKFSPSGKRWKRCQQFVCEQSGFTLEEFRHHCRKALKEESLTPFPFQKELLQYLKSKNHFIYVVTASIKWLVEEACRLHSLPVDKVLGAETVVKDGLITDQMIQPLTHGIGKKTVFLKSTNNHPPLFASGNTQSDVPLLEMAKVRLVIRSSKEGNEDFESEQTTEALARKEGWFIWKPKEETEIV